MIKQNIKVALFVVLGIITFWLILFSFIKLNVTTTIAVNFDSREFILDKKSAAYIDSHGRRDKLWLEYESQYFLCKVFDGYQEDNLIHYPIKSLDPGVTQVTGILQTHLIMDSLNVYHYLIKK